MVEPKRLLMRVFPLLKGSLLRGYSVLDEQRFDVEKGLAEFRIFLKKPLGPPFALGQYCPSSA